MFSFPSEEQKLRKAFCFLCRAVERKSWMAVSRASLWASVGERLQVRSASFIRWCAIRTSLSYHDLDLLHTRLVGTCTCMRRWMASTRQPMLSSISVRVQIGKGSSPARPRVARSVCASSIICFQSALAQFRPRVGVTLSGLSWSTVTMSSWSVTAM